MKKTILFASILVLLISIGTVWCGGQKEATEKVRITWLNHLCIEYGDDWCKEVEQRFEKKNPDIDLVPETAPFWDNYEQLVTWARTGSEMPDVFGGMGLWSPSIDAFDALEDLGSWIDAAGPDYRAKSGALGAKAATFGGKVLFTTAMGWPYTVIYNQGLFKEAGIEPPSGYAELRAVLKKIRDVEKNVYGSSLVLGKTDANMAVFHIFMGMLADKGGTMVNEDGSAGFNSPEGVAVIKYIKSLIDDDLVVPGSLGEGANQERDYFTSGQTYMVIGEGPYMKGICKATSPDMVVATTSPKNVNGASYYYWGWSMAKSSKHKDEAWKFIEWWQNDEDAPWLMDTMGMPFFNPKIWEDPVLKEDPVFKYFEDYMALPNNIMWPNIGKQDELSHMFQETVYFEVIQNNADPSKALDNAANKWNKIFGLD